MTLVQVDGVSKSFAVSGGTVRAVSDVSFEVTTGETLALIGESGSGKSTLGRLLLGLYQPDSGTIEFAGQDLTSLSRSRARAIRSQLTVVFQEPDESLNPKMTVIQNIAEPLHIHEPDLGRTERRNRVLETLEMVALDNRLADRYPRQLSGGEQQRVGVARAIITNPAFVVLDEPTSSLDLSVRSQIINLLADLRSRLNLSFLFISHDIHTVRHISDRIAVMYLGRLVEIGPTEEVFNNSGHPYTLSLLASTLSPDPRQRLPSLRLSGDVPKPTDLPEGCVFYSRCPFRDDVRCEKELPPMRQVGPNHFVATFYDISDEDREDVRMRRQS